MLNCPPCCHDPSFSTLPKAFGGHREAESKGRGPVAGVANHEEKAPLGAGLRACRVWAADRVERPGRRRAAGVPKRGIAKDRLAHSQSDPKLDARSDTCSHAAANSRATGAATLAARACARAGAGCAI